MGGRLE
jgi:chromosome segregation ATPase